MPLVFVPTPLGNLRDITLRSLDALRDAALIVAEDTRVARKLLAALDLGQKDIWSYREQNADSVTAGILARATDQLVAVVTDAGMPGISVPGTDLAAAARAAGVPIEVLPGPSAALGVAVLSGFPLRRFCFEGFPPRASRARREAFELALRAEITTIWYESPQRIADALGDLAAVAPTAEVFLVREYTKKFEQQVLGTAAEVAAALEYPVRGEISFAVSPVALGTAESGEVDRETAMLALLDEGRSVSEVARTLAASGAGDRRELYALASDLKRARGKGSASGAERTT